MVQDKRNSITFKKPTRLKLIILYVFDCILSLFILPITGVAFWASVDSCLELVENIRLRTAIVFLCAFLFVLMHLASKTIYRVVRGYAAVSTIGFFIIAKSYIYLSSVCGCIVYDGFFEQYLYDVPWANEVLPNCLLVIVCFAILFCMKCYPHLAGTSASDVGQESTPEDVFLFPFRLFECSWKKNRFLYFMDSIFSVLLVGTLVILVWRGAWTIVDGVIFPGDDNLSILTSLVIGYGIVFIAIVSQPLMKKLMRKCDGWKQILILDTYIVVSFWGSINQWRGIWSILEHIIDLRILMNCLLLHFISFFILVVFNASNSLLVRGVYIDAEESAEDCIEFPCYYFRLRFQSKQKKETPEELERMNIQVANVHHNHVDDPSSSAHDGVESINSSLLNKTTDYEFDKNVSKNFKAGKT